MTSTEPLDSPTRGAPPPIRLQAVSKWFGNVVAVNRVHLHIGPGVFALFGPNGAGKSTLLKLIAGHLRPSSGAVEVAGSPAFGNPETYGRLGAAFRDTAPYPFLEVGELLRLKATLHGCADPTRAVALALDSLGLTSVAGERFSTLSRGTQQRTRLAVATVHRPSLLVLDEPFEGLDQSERARLNDLFDTFRASGATVVLTTHVIDDIRDLADEIAVMDDGQLVASGPPHRLRRALSEYPYHFVLRSSDDRVLARTLVSDNTVRSVRFEADGLMVAVDDRGDFAAALPRIAQAQRISLHHVEVTDESIEAVLRYLLGARDALR